MNEIKTGACINYISIIVRLATQFFLTPFTLSSLGENEYGIFMLSNSVIAWLSLTDFGLGVTVNKYIATYHAKKENDREAHFLGQAMMLFSFLGLLTFAAGMICYVNLGALFPNLSGPELAIHCRNSHDLVACRFNGPFFMAIYMACRSCYDPLIALKASGNDRQIRLRPAYKKFYIDRAIATGLPD